MADNMDATGRPISLRTCAVVFFMSMSWALSFYPVIVFQAIGDKVAAELGQVSTLPDPSSSYHHVELQERITMNGGESC